MDDALRLRQGHTTQKARGYAENGEASNALEQSDERGFRRDALKDAWIGVLQRMPWRWP